MYLKVFANFVDDYSTRTVYVNKRQLAFLRCKTQSYYIIRRTPLFSHQVVNVKCLRLESVSTVSYSKTT